MDDVRRKKVRKPLSKGKILLLAAGVLLLAAGGWWLTENNKPTVPAPSGKVDTYKMLAERDLDTLTTIRVTPPSGESYTILYADDVMSVPGREDDALDSLIELDILSWGAAVEAHDTILNTEENEVLLSDFGLDPAQASITYCYSDGEEITLLLGNNLPDESAYYFFMMQGDPNIYSAAPDLWDAASYEKDTLFKVVQPKLKGELLDAITLAGDADLRLERTATGWTLTAPSRYPVDSAAAGTLLTNIEGMRFANYLGSADALNLADYGLDVPRLTITLDQAATVLYTYDDDDTSYNYEIPAHTITLMIGNDANSVGIYCLYEGKVYVGTSYSLGFWQQLTAKKLQLRNPIDWAANQLTYISLATAAQSVAYDISFVEQIKENNEIATDDYGQTLYSVVATRNGQAVDETAFVHWYYQLTQVSATGFLPAGYAPSGEPVAEIVMKNDYEQRTIRLYPYDALHVAIEVDGVCVFYMRSNWEGELDAAP